eukprot:6540589-Ditylum_brightwellii.AAC.1
MEGKFDLVEALVEVDSLTHWMEFKHVETMCISKNLDRMDAPPKGICSDAFKVCLQELKKHYFLKNLACLQKTYLCNYVKKLNKLSIKNTPAQLHKMNGRLTHFPAQGHNPMVEDELCNIIYQIVKHGWRNALCKSSRKSTDLSFQDLVDYFKQIKLLDDIKQKPKTIVVDNNTDKKKKLSSYCKKNANSDKNARSDKPKVSQDTKMSS